MWRGIFKKANKFFNAILMDTLAITVLTVHSVFHIDYFPLVR